MRLKLYISFIFLMTSLITFSQYPDLVWGDQFIGEPINGNFPSRTMVTDKDNNTYLTSSFKGVVQFGTAATPFNFDCGLSGSHVMFKFNPNGSLEWILPIFQARTFSFDVDNEGNLVVYFMTLGSNVDINHNGTPTLITAPSIVIAKYHSNGELDWYKSESISSGVGHHLSIVKLDGSNNIYISGRFSGTQDFDFDSNSVNFTNYGLSSDIFCSKYSSEGVLVWSKQIASSGVYEPALNAMAINGNGSVFIGATYVDTMFVDPVGTNVQLVATDEFGYSTESCLISIGSSGSLNFARTFQSSEPNDIVGIEADNLNIYIAHYFFPDVNMNPNAGAPYYPNIVGGMLRLSVNSTFISNFELTDTGARVQSFQRTPQNTFLFSGRFANNVDFDPTDSGVNNFYPGPSPSNAFYITEFSNQLDYLGTRVLYSPSFISKGMVRRSNNGSVSFGGSNYSSLDIDYNSGTNTLTNAQSYESEMFSYYSAELPELNVVNEHGYSINSGSTTPSLLNSTDFGDLCLNDSRTITYSMVNTGVGDLTVSNVSITGVDAALYSHNGTSGIIQSGDTTYISVSITGTSVGAKNATLIIQNDDSDEATYQFDISTTVRELPNVGYAISPNNSTFCYGDLVMLHGTGAETYNWNNGVSDSVTFPITQNGFYLVTGTSVYGCLGSSAVGVTVNQLPTVSVVSNDPDNSICLNDSIQLTGLGAQSYTYSNGVLDQTDFYPTTSTNYTVTGTDANGCVNDTNITITVFNLPSVSVSSNDPNDEICLNEVIQLIGAGASSYVYSNGVIDQTDFYPVSTETYSITGTDNNGCSNSANITITVNPLPVVSVSSNSVNDEICLNDPIQLIGAGATSYSYTNGVIDQTDFYPTSDNSYTVTGTDANGCQNTANIFVTVNPLPTVSVISSDLDNTICLNDTIQLTASGASTYSYTNGVTDQIYFAPSSTATYQVMGTDGNGCQNIDSIEISVNPLPIVSITSSDNDNSICLNDSIQLSGGGAQTYIFDNGVQSGIYFEPQSTNTYSVTGVDTNGCENTNQITIVVNALPIVAVSSNDVNDSICIGDSIALTGFGAQSYVYSNGVTDQTYFSPSANETYSIIGTDANGCVSMDSITITVESLPTLDGGLDLFVCFGDSTMLNATGTGTVTWTGNITNGAYFVPLGSTTELICTAVSQSGCINTDTITVEMGNQINTNTTIIGLAIQANDNYDNYEWFDCQTGSTLQSGIQSSFFPTLDGEYAVVLSGSDGCSDTSSCVIIDFLDVPNLTNVQLHFIPNPTNGILKVTNSEQLKTIQVYDSFGRLLLSTDQNLNIIDLSEFANGQYLIRGILHNGETVIERIIKE